MTRQRKKRRCLRCSRLNAPLARQCVSCGSWLVKKPFRMNVKRIKLVHTLAAKKGLIVGEDDELYRLRLQRIGVDSCKQFKRNDFNIFITELKKLPDV